MKSKNVLKVSNKIIVFDDIFKECSNRVYLEANENEEGFFSHVDINISMKRRSLFYTFNYVLPSIMITILSISGFLLPAESGEKIGLRKFNFYLLDKKFNSRSFIFFIVRFNPVL